MAVSNVSPSIIKVYGDMDRPLDNANLNDSKLRWRIDHNPDGSGTVAMMQFAGSAGGMLPGLNGWDKEPLKRNNTCRGKFLSPTSAYATVFNTPEYARKIEFGCADIGGGGNAGSDTGVEIRIPAKVQIGREFRVQYGYRPLGINNNSFEGHMMVVAHSQNWLSGSQEILHNRIEGSVGTYTHSKKYTSKYNFITVIFRMIRKAAPGSSNTVYSGRCQYCVVTRLPSEEELE